MWTAVPRDSQEIAPVRRYVRPPRDPHDWLRASGSVVWLCTPALLPQSHGYKSKVPTLRSYGATTADLTWTAVLPKRQPRDRAGKAIPEVTTGPPRLAQGFRLGGMGMYASPVTAEPRV